MKKIKILLVDDHEIVRKGLSLVFSTEPLFEVVNDCESAEKALEFLSNNTTIDVLVTDVSMPGMNGIELLKITQKKFPQVKAVVLSMHLDESYISAALKAGAQSYLAKDSNEQDIIDAIKSVYKDTLYLTKTVSDVLAQSYINKSEVKNTHKKLTKREKEILNLIVEGLSNKMIADKLFISDSTVNAHRYNLMQKMNAKNTADLVRMSLNKNIFL